MSSVRSVRAPDKDWDRWRTCAALSGLSLNAWIGRALGHVAQVEESLVKQQEAEK